MSGRTVRVLLLLTLVAVGNLMRDRANHHSFSAALSGDWYWFAVAFAITAHGMWLDRHPEIEAADAREEGSQTRRMRRVTYFSVPPRPRNCHGTEES